LERQALELLARVEALGGAAKAIAAAFFQEEIARSAYEHQMRVERGETVIVGVNKFTDDSQIADMATPDYSRLEKEQAERVRAAKTKRDASRFASALDALGKTADRFSARGDIKATPLVPAIVEAVRARATVGEIANVLRSRWGSYRPA
jgi:methylmalonyl-CoA mutase N-terminal domain/subunit